MGGRTLRNRKKEKHAFEQYAYEEEEEKEEEEFYEVEKITDKVDIEGDVFYYIKWQGYPDEESTWEIAENLVHCPLLLEEFEKKRAVLRKTSEEAIEEADGLIDIQSNQNNHGSSDQTTTGKPEAASNGNPPDDITPEVLPQLRSDVTVKSAAHAQDGGLYFLIQRKDAVEEELISEKEAITKFPQSVIKFCEDRLSWLRDGESLVPNSDLED